VRIPRSETLRKQDMMRKIRGGKTDDLQMMHALGIVEMKLIVE